MFVGENYQVTSDDLNVTVLKKETAKQSGVVRWRPIGYFSSIKYALRFLVDLGVKQTELKDFETVDKKVDELFRLVGSLKVTE